MATDIQSPPYPSETATADALYSNIAALRKWVVAYRDQHNTAVGRLVVPALKKLPARDAYGYQPLKVQFFHLLFLRRVREQWDRLVRTYEDDWDDKRCVQQRALLLVSAAMVVNTAGLSTEQREATGQDVDRLQSTFDQIGGVIKKLMEPAADETDPLFDG